MKGRYRFVYSAFLGALRSLRSGTTLNGHPRFLRSLNPLESSNLDKREDHESV